MMCKPLVTLIDSLNMNLAIVCGPGPVLEHQVEHFPVAIFATLWIRR